MISSSTEVARADNTTQVCRVIALVGLLCWGLSHAYQGITHDARLYALQALGRLSPTSIGQDVFLKYGSQDHFTVFSPLFAAAASGLGTETAAALLTWVSQMLLFGGAWLLARRLMSPSMAVIALCTLVAIPGDYGSERVFVCIEPFLTPRMGAVALVLFSISALLDHRRVLAIVLMACAALIHPIMALAGFVLLLHLTISDTKPVLALAIALVAVKALVLQALLMPDGQWGRFDTQWFQLVVARSPFLFLSHWSIDDWARVAVTATTLIVAIGTPQLERVQSLCKGVLLTVASGLILTLLACDLLHLVIFTQLQPWRWQWLGTIVAALVLPEVLRGRWRGGTPDRASALLLVAAWVFASNEYALAASAAAVLSSIYLHRLKPSESRWILLGSWGLLAIAMAWRLASNLEFTDSHYLSLHLPLWIRQATSFVHDGSAALLVVLLAAWLGRQSFGRPALRIMAAMMLAACVMVLPHTWRQWTALEYAPDKFAQFAGLRAQIPAGANVLWAESPLSVWLLLDRPSYISVVQTSGMVFSRQSALELSRRAEAIGGVIAPDTFMKWSTGGSALNLSAPQLHRLCDTQAIDFIVSRQEMGVAPIATLRSGSGPASKPINLYRCSPAAG